MGSYPARAFHALAHGVPVGGTAYALALEGFNALMLANEDQRHLHVRDGAGRVCGNSAVRRAARPDT